jgi:hypothetical protein
MAKHDNTKKAAKYIQTGADLYSTYQQMQQQQPTRRSFEDDEDLFVRDLDDEEFYGREFDDDLEAREPVKFSLKSASTAVGWVNRMSKHEHTKKAVKYLKTGADLYSSYQQQQQQPTRRSFEDDEDVFVLRDLDDEEFFGREYDYDLFDERDIIDDLD